MQLRPRLDARRIVPRAWTAKLPDWFLMEWMLEASRGCAARRLKMLRNGEFKLKDAQAAWKQWEQDDWERRRARSEARWRSCSPLLA
jgi:hypothetical protein